MSLTRRNSHASTSSIADVPKTHVVYTCAGKKVTVNKSANNDRVRESIEPCEHCSCCALTGFPISIHAEDGPYKVELARLDTEVGYVKGNIMLVCKVAYDLKNKDTWSARQRISTTRPSVFVIVAGSVRRN